MTWGLSASPVAQREYLDEMKKMEQAEKERKERKEQKTSKKAGSKNDDASSVLSDNMSTASTLRGASDNKPPSDPKEVRRQEKRRFYEAVATTLALK